MVHKRLPQAHIIPGNPGAERTTGRAGTKARTGTIVHPPSGLAPGCDRQTRPTRHGSSMNQTLVWVSDVSWSVMTWDGGERLLLAPAARRLSVVAAEGRRERIHR